MFKIDLEELFSPTNFANLFKLSVRGLSHVTSKQTYQEFYPVSLHRLLFFTNQNLEQSHRTSFVTLKIWIEDNSSQISYQVARLLFGSHTVMHSF